MEKGRALTFTHSPPFWSSCSSCSSLNAMDRTASVFHASSFYSSNLSTRLSGPRRVGLHILSTLPFGWWKWHLLHHLVIRCARWHVFVFFFYFGVRHDAIGVLILLMDRTYWQLIFSSPPPSSTLFIQALTLSTRGRGACKYFC